jgi:Tfp pilus assembly protein FimT
MAYTAVKQNGFVCLTEVAVAAAILSLVLTMAMSSVTWDRERHSVDILTRQLALDLQKLRQHSLGNGNTKSDMWVLRIDGDMYYIKQNYTRRKELRYPGKVSITPWGKEIYFHDTGKPEGTMSFTISSQDKTYSRKVIVASQTGRIRLQ